MRIVHYINQFFAGVGGEDSADTPPSRADGAVGPGRRLAGLLGDDHQVVATVWCGDDHATSTAGAIDQIVALVRAEEPDLVVAGPAFTSGRYGLACARVAAALATEGIAAVAAMHEENPGVEEAGTAIVIRSGRVAREMGPSIDRLAAAVVKLLAGETLGEEDGRIGKIPRRNVMAEKPAGERAVDLVLSRLAGDRSATEVPLPRFDVVTPAPPVDDLSTAVVALVTEGALVPDENPDRLESARATKWLRYRIEDRDSLPAGEFRSVHGGFSTVWANEDPHRIIPLDVARELEREGAIGGLHNEYLVTVGNGTSVADARRFGVEWAADLRRSGARAAILTAT